MDFRDEIKLLGDRVSKLKDQIQTEEATKNAFIMPFLKALGYDVFNPLEVVPEFVADIGLKKGEKIDYAIFKDGIPTLLVECKHWAQNLDLHDGQLLRYFHVSKAKFGLLTNGIIFRFYSDLAEPNKMDEKPFLEFNIIDIKDNQIEELKKFHKSYFDIDSIVATASELKYMNELKGLLQLELANPSPDFVKHFARQVYPGMITQKILDQFTALTKKSVQFHISDLITDRLKSALQKEDQVATQETPEAGQEETPNESKVVTTDDEINAYLIVKAILRKSVGSSRIVHRDAQSYFSVLLDDNNRKPLCRLYLNGGKKYIGLFDEQKKETRHELPTLDNIYDHADALMLAADRYEKGKDSDS